MMKRPGPHSRKWRARAGALAFNARPQLPRAIDARKTTPPALPFDTYVALTSHSVPPEPPPTVLPRRPSPRIAMPDLSACRACHPREHEGGRRLAWQRCSAPYQPENVIGDFTSGQTVNGSARAVLDGGRHFIEIRRGKSPGLDPLPGGLHDWLEMAAGLRHPAGRSALPGVPDSVQPGDTTLAQLLEARRLTGVAACRHRSLPRGPRGSDLPDDVRALPYESAAVAKGAVPPEAATFDEGGINCETCHGPSRAHAEA